jgi:hypothetical protein
MQIGRGNQSTRRKPAPVPVCPPQIPRDLTRARSRAAAVGSGLKTAGYITPPPPPPRMVSMCTTSFRNSDFYPQSVFVSCGSHNEQRLSR